MCPSQHTLAKDRDALLAFYDFPAEHWVHLVHLRTSNVIESDHGHLPCDVGRHKAVAAGKGASLAQGVAMAKRVGRCSQISIEAHKGPVFVFLPDTSENKPPMFVGSR